MTLLLISVLCAALVYILIYGILEFETRQTNYYLCVGCLAFYFCFASLLGNFSLIDSQNYNIVAAFTMLLAMLFISLSFKKSS